MQNKRIKEVYYQVNTKNISFIKMFKMMSDLGIKNNKFHLTLYDKELMDIDPLDEDNLTVEQKARVIREVQQNFWYFVREIVRIPVPGGVKPYDLHRGNLALNWCLIRNLNSLLILPRQNGKTIGAVVYYLWLYNFGTTNSEIMFMNKSFDDSKLNLRRIKEIREQLPTYLQVFNPRIDTDNVTHLKNGTNNNKIVAKPTATAEAQADNLGRGCTQPSQWYDEFAFLKYNSIIYA